MTLEEWLKWKGWTKKKFAKKLQVSISSIQYWTRAKKKPNKNMAIRIEKITRGMVKAIDLLNQESWKK